MIGNYLKSQKDILQVELNKNSKGEASTTNINEGDGFGLLSSIVNALKTKMNRFEQHFENFQSETNRNFDVLFHKSETNSNEQKEEIDRLREENHQLKLDNADLIQRLNNHVHNIADLNNKVKAIEEEKASLLTVMQLLQSKVDESNKRDTWSRTRTNNFRRNAPTQSNKDSQLNNILVSNQYAPLTIDEPENDEVIESIKISEESESPMKTNKSSRNYNQNCVERKHKQQQNGLKPTHKETQC